MIANRPSHLVLDTVFSLIGTLLEILRGNFSWMTCGYCQHCMSNLSLSTHLHWHYNQFCQDFLIFHKYSDMLLWNLSKLGYYKSFMIMMEYLLVFVYLLEVINIKAVAPTIKFTAQGLWKCASNCFNNVKNAVANLASTNLLQCCLVWGLVWCLGHCHAFLTFDDLTTLLATPKGLKFVETFLLMFLFFQIYKQSLFNDNI